MNSEHIEIISPNGQFDRVEEVLNDFVTHAEIKDKNALRFRLLTEEALRLVRSIDDNCYPIELWFEGNKRIAHICIKLKDQLDADKEAQFVSVSSTNTNSADRTFIDDIKEFFVKPKTPTWTLSQYEAEILKKRSEDKYASEAWDNLERSVLANLADDISVGVKDNHVLMIITKDFSIPLAKKASSLSKALCDQIFVASDEKAIASAYEKVDKCIEQLELKGHDSFRVRLLFEETIGMVENMIGDFTALLWAEKNNGQCLVKLVGNTTMDADKKYDLLSVSKSGENALVQGFMGKIRDIIETGTLNYDAVMKLNQQYNGISVNFGGPGIYSDLSMSTIPTATSGFMWSVEDYRSSLAEDMDKNEGKKAAWDELEKSIVAKVADDVIVGVKGNTVKITMVYKLKED